MKKTFNGWWDDEVASTPHNGQQVNEKVQNINIVFKRHKIIPLRRTFERNDQYSLVFHIGVN